MNCFKLPFRTCIDIDIMVANFWWGQHKNEGKNHWVAWSKLTKANCDGGLGFWNSLVSILLSLLSKLGELLRNLMILGWKFLGIYTFQMGTFFTLGRVPGLLGVGQVSLREEIYCCKDCFGELEMGCLLIFGLIAGFPNYRMACFLVAVLVVFLMLWWLMTLL